jgi:hypothetical protein
MENIPIFTNIVACVIKDAPMNTRLSVDSYDNIWNIIIQSVDF